MLTPPWKLIISLHILFVSAFLFYFFLFYIHLAVSASPVHTKKFALPALVKGVGFEKGRGIPLPFSVFLVPFVTSQKERPFLFPLEKEHSSFLLERNKFFSTPETEVFMLFFPYRKANTPFAGCGKRSFSLPGGIKKRGALPLFFHTLPFPLFIRRYRADPAGNQQSHSNTQHNVQGGWRIFNRIVRRIGSKRRISVL